MRLLEGLDLGNCTIYYDKKVREERREEEKKATGWRDLSPRPHRHEASALMLHPMLELKYNKPELRLKALGKIEWFFSELEGQNQWS